MRKFFIISSVLLYISGWSQATKAQDMPGEPARDTAARKIVPIGNITVLGSYSKVCGGDNLSGLYTAANFAPAIRLDERNYFIPLYNGLYKRQRQIINEEEGGRLYTTVMSHNLSFMHKHIYSEVLTQRITSFVSLNYNKETQDESFGDGLYDWRDFGMNFDYQYNLIGKETDKGTLLFGGKYYFRKYPNFKSLISLTRDDVPEEDEKDQNMWGATTRYTHRFAERLILSLSYELLFKRFTDKRTVDLNGILEDEKRKDRVHYIKLESDYRLTKNLILGLDGEIEMNNSNQNYYDTMNTTGNIADDVFIPHYFNYNRYEIKPSLTYLFTLGKNKNVMFKLAYAYTSRDYPNRNVKDSDGTYKSETQEDKIHAGYLNINFPITKKLSFLINADYIHNISNMEYERYYRYDYDIYHILSGFSYKF